MAAESTKKILSIASKKASRAKEKFTQKIRHEDGTTDEGFAMFVTNFNKQQTGVKKLQKELAKYITAVKGLNIAAKSLSEVLVEVYEPEWDGSEEFKNYAEQRNLLYEDIVNRLNSDVVTPVNDYLLKFPDMQKKIEKRDRKLTDHDMTKREFEKLKTKDAVKAKGQDVKKHAEEKYTQAKQLYDEITDELYRELPSLYDSRIEFIAKLYELLSRHELQFHSQVSQIEEKVLQLLTKLSEEAAMGVHSTKRERDAGPSSFTQPSYQDTTSEGGNGSLAEQGAAEGITPAPSETTLPSSGEQPAPTTPVVQLPARSPSLTKVEPLPKPTPPEPTTPTAVQSRPPKPTRVSGADEQPKEQSPDRNSAEIAATPPSIPVAVKLNVPEVSLVVAESGEEGAAEQIHAEDGEATENAHIPTDGSGNEVPPVTHADEPAVPAGETRATSPSVSAPSERPVENVPTTASPSEDAAVSDEKEKHSQEEPEPLTVLFKVVAAHPYKGEDEDELTFDKGAVIFVIPYEDPDDEEDGWKMGFIPSTKAKGIFPENFTKPFH